LDITYNLDLLLELSRTMKESLLGPLGDYYLENSKDVLYDICEKMWNVYILPVLQRIEVYIELRAQKEYGNEFIQNLDE